MNLTMDWRLTTDGRLRFLSQFSALHFDWLFCLIIPVFAHTITFIHGGGIKLLFAAGLCFLFCLSAYAGLENGKAADANITQLSAEPQPDTESAVIISTETLAAGATDAVMPAPVLEQQAETKVVPEETEAPQHKLHRVWLWQETRDCLWNLAKIYYNDPWQWKKIYLANKSQIKDPRIIYPKQELIIPPIDEPEK